MQQSVRNVCAKFKIDPLSRFCTGARQVFTTQKLFSSETMKTATSNSLETHFLIKLSSVKFGLKSLMPTNWYSTKKVNIWTPSGYFTFFLFIFLLKWNKQEIFKRRHEKDQKQSPQPATLLKKRLCQRFFLHPQQNTSSGCYWNMKNSKADNMAENFFYRSYWN